MDKKTKYEAIRDGDFRLNNYWPLISEIRTLDNNTLNLNSTNTLATLISNPEYFDAMIDTITNQTKDFVEAYHDLYFSSKD